MFFARRTALLRITAMAALVASAVLTADHLRPGRAFCPLEQACELAAGSLLGSVAGVPTAVLGMVAFGGLFLLTLLPVEWSRPLLRPAGLLAAIAGVGFVVYQAMVLHSFCPLCLVADVAGLFAGMITLTWPRPPVRLSGQRLPGEALYRRAGWTVVAAVAVWAPFAWPRPTEPAWVEIEPLHETAFEEQTPLPDPDPEVATTPPPTPAPPVTSTEDTETSFSVPAIPPPPTAPEAAAPSAVTAPKPATVATPAPPAPPAPRPAAPPVRPAPLLVEYLNAYCAHCRATHRRLDKVLAESRVPFRRRRVYTWASKEVPAWARACAYAGTLGLEERLFEELLTAPNTSITELYAAARRAGIDTQGLRTALSRPHVPERLRQDRALVDRARLRGLPTIDVGRRRLMGEQSETELRAALRAALPPTAR